MTIAIDRAAEHQGGLDHVGPDDRLDPADGGVEAGEKRESTIAPEYGWTLVDRRELDRCSGPVHDSCHASTMTIDGTNMRVPEASVRITRNRAGDVVLRDGAEADAEVVVDGVDLVG